MKSRRPARIVLVGASALALAGCQEETVEADVFRDPAACEAAGLGADDCAAAFEAAAAEHAETAPRYDALAVCEEQHGEDACVAEERGGSSIFLPLMAGYLLGSALGGARARPLVPSQSGFRTTDGRVATSALAGRTAVSPTALDARPASTRGAAPLTRSTVARTGGFGAARTAAGGLGAGG